MSPKAWVGIEGDEALTAHTTRIKCISNCQGVDKVAGRERVLTEGRGTRAWAWCEVRGKIGSVRVKYTGRTEDKERQWKVVVQEFEVRVYDEYVIRGNTAVLRCVVPPFVRDLVTVTAWVRDHAHHIYPSLHGGEYKVLVSL
ncbi:hypothetical protein O3P69_013418 [Scylla paramamosain]|uniref:Uncharacterized protein n=1 Tax=Scylla paramamosain TaxID=85552 RepID=A0AAW0U142_SCYPA